MQNNPAMLAGIRGYGRTITESDMTNATSNMREYKRRWAAARRAEWMAGKSCVQCGSTQSLEVDHIDPTLKVTHSVWSWSIPRRTVELAKCQVL